MMTKSCDTADAVELLDLLRWNIAVDICSKDITLVLFWSNLKYFLFKECMKYQEVLAVRNQVEKNLFKSQYITCIGSTDQHETSDICEQKLLKNLF